MQWRVRVRVCACVCSCACVVAYMCTRACGVNSQVHIYQVCVYVNFRARVPACAHLCAYVFVHMCVFMCMCAGIRVTMGVARNMCLCKGGRT